MPREAKQGGTTPSRRGSQQQSESEGEAWGAGDTGGVGHLPITPRRGCWPILQVSSERTPSRPHHGGGGVVPAFEPRSAGLRCVLSLPSHPPLTNVSIFYALTFGASVTDTVYFNIDKFPILPRHRRQPTGFTRIWKNGEKSPFNSQGFQKLQQFSEAQRCLLSSRR